MQSTEGFDYSEKEQDTLFEGIYLGVIGLASLPRKLYYETAGVLKKGLYNGWGKTILQVKFGSPDYKLLNELRENIYIFSGAKTATQVMDIKSLMYDGDKILTMSQFKKAAKVKFADYNTTKLETEFITATTTASSAVNYKDALDSKGLFPYLTAHVIVDDRTAPECLRMNGITAKVDDPIWIHNLAARHFNCRCFETKESKYDDVKPTSRAKLNEIIKKNDEDMNELFKFNPVRDKIIFSNKHPYYDIGRNNKELAKRNFNLPIPDAEQRKKRNK